MTKEEAVRILDAWSKQVMIRAIMPEIVTAVRITINKPQVSVGVSKVRKKLRWREKT